MSLKQYTDEQIEAEQAKRKQINSLTSQISYLDDEMAELLKRKNELKNELIKIKGPNAKN